MTLVQDLPRPNESDQPQMSSTKPKNMLTRVNTGLLSPLGLTLIKANLNMIQTPPYYRELALADVPSQYAEEVDTFRCILSLPDTRESMPRSSTSVMGLDDEKGRQELRPRGPSSMLPLSSVIKDAFDKFEHDFKAANLPEG